MPITFIDSEVAHKAYTKLLLHPWQSNKLKVGVPKSPAFPTRKEHCLASGVFKTDSSGKAVVLFGVHHMPFSNQNGIVTYGATTQNHVGDGNMDSASDDLFRVIAAGLKLYYLSPAETAQGIFSASIHPVGSAIASSATINTLTQWGSEVHRIKQGHLCDLVWAPRRPEHVDLRSFNDHQANYDIAVVIEGAAAGSSFAVEGIVHYETFHEGEDLRQLTANAGPDPLGDAGIAAHITHVRV